MKISGLTSDGITVDRRLWLVKFAPFRTSWTEIVRSGAFTLRGVRNMQSRNNLAHMAIGDYTFFYHSQEELAIVGLLRVTRTAYPDPSAADPKWLACDFTPEKTLSNPVPLAAIKADPRFARLGLVRQPRLAVMPISEQQFNAILDLSTNG